MYIHLSILQYDHYVLLFMAFGCVLREQLGQQFIGGSDAGKACSKL
jgi:hypothetical protein